MNGVDPPIGHIRGDEPAAAVPAPPTDQPVPVDQLHRAEVIDIGIGDDESDPFDATLLLGATSEQGADIALWVHLTPTLITELREQLTAVFRAQQRALGVTTSDPTATAEPNNDQPVVAEPLESSARLKRLFDPIGLRHLRDRSPRSTVLLAVLIASLLVLTLLIQIVGP